MPRPSSRFLSAAAALTALLLAGCGATGESAESQPTTAPREPEAAAHVGKDAALERAAFVRARQRSGSEDSRYSFGAVEGLDAALYAAPQPLGFAAMLGAGAVRVTGARQSWELALEVHGYGCGEQRVSVRRAAAPTLDARQPGRAHYRHSSSVGPLDEWYLLGPLGLEHGFTIARSPCPAASPTQQLSVELGIEGLTPVLRDRPAAASPSAPVGAVIELVDADAVPRAYYSDLSVEDATGRVLPSRFELEGQKLIVRVDVARATYPVLIDPLLWTLTTELVPGDVSANDYFGHALSLRDDLLLTSAFGADSGRGRVYLYRRSGEVWSLEQQLSVGGGNPNDSFGYALSLLGDGALIAAPASAGNLGAVRFYKLGPGGLGLEQTIPASSTSVRSFGNALASSGASALIAAPLLGEVYVYTRDGDTWTKQATLTVAGVQASDQFGRAVGLEGDTAVIGAYGSNGNQGRAYVFRRSGSSWSLQATLQASDPAPNMDFGFSVGIASGTVLVGARRSGGSVGSAYVFRSTGSAWTQRARLTSGSVVGGQYFGQSVALSSDGRAAAVGAYGLQSMCGGVFTFAETNGTWTREHLLQPATCAVTSSLGYSTELSGVYLATGAPLTNASAGAVQLFKSILTDGSRCTSPGDCSSGFCVDGVCCNLPCTEPCAACSIAAGAANDGVCASASAGSPGRPPCTPLSCTGLSRQCAQCTSDLHCVDGDYCGADGNCHPGRATGERCADAAHVCRQPGCRLCASGHCVDDVCCAAACDGLCESCAEAHTGAADGTCAPVAAGTDPKAQCVDPPANSCGPDGTCDGNRQCRSVAPVGKQCGDSVCANGVVSGSQCNGAGACRQQATASCSPYRCDPSGDACRTACASSADCIDQYYCDAAGRCQSQKDTGLTCLNNAECRSGHCVDGVCCEQSCEGQCEACNRPGSLGRCVAVVGAPAGGRQPCDGVGDCAGACNGGDRDRCVMPRSGTSCGQARCSGDTSIPSGLCDGAGACAVASGRRCHPYGCDDASGLCRTGCRGDGDCAAGNVCHLSLGSCVADGNRCKDAHTVVSPDGTETSCAPYRCAAGQCRDTCASELECADGFRCRAGTCEVREPNDAGDGGAQDAGDSGARDAGPRERASADDGGCACSGAPRRAGSTPLSASLFALTLALGAARRRQHRASARP